MLFSQYCVAPEVVTPHRTKHLHIKLNNSITQ